MERLLLTIEVANESEAEDFGPKVAEAFAHLGGLEEVRDGQLEPGSEIVAPNGVRVTVVEAEIQAGAAA